MPIFQTARNLDFISVQELADDLNGEEKTIQLPSFQRDAIWNEEHIEKLWDSILRNFPIGSLLFARVKDLDIDRIGLRKMQGSPSEAAHQTSTEANSTELIVIDGQQRSIAIALGLRTWQQKDSARLWIDLGQPAKPETEPYRFYACSFLRPWGRNATTAMQREALHAVDANILKSENSLKLNDETLRYTWPVRAQLPVPFADLLNWLSNSAAGDWRQFVPEAKQSGMPREDIDALFEKIKKTVSYQIPVFLAENLSVEELGQVFHRLNKLGYEMSNEELFFSALKMTWPKAHDLVWDIFSDEQTGRFMQPTKIVHLAVRLVAVPNGSDVIRLDRDEFKKFVERKDDRGKTYLSSLKDLLRKKDVDQAEIGRLNHCLRLARQTLQYNPDLGEHDPGLPITLLARLRWRVWHTIAAWIYRNETVDTFSRSEMLRYALLDHFYTKSTSTTLIRKPFELALKAKGPFPGCEIYQELKKRKRLDPDDILTPADYDAGLTESELPVGAILHRERDLVLWTQRDYFHQWFPQFDPTLYKKETDLPYDLDHIIPQAYLNMRGRRHKLPHEFWVYRDPILHGPGNVRYWPKALNRADGSKNLDKKHLLGESDIKTPDDSYLRDIGLSTVGDVRRASFILDTQLSDWEQVSNIGHDPYNWSNADRMKAFRKVTELRRQAMYTSFFEQIGWGDWLENDDSPPADEVSQ